MLLFPNFEPAFAIAYAALVVATLIGLCSLLLAIGRSRAGSVLGGLLVLCGVGITVTMLRDIPRYWWLGMPPMYFGIQSLLTWQHASPSFTKIRLSSILLLTCFLLLLAAGYGSIYRQRQFERPIVEELESIVGDNGGQVYCHADGIASSVLVYCSEAMDMDRAVELISQLTCLESIQVYGAGFAGVDLAMLLKLNRLRDFLVQQTDLSDEQLIIISDLPRLESLDIMDTPVTDMGVLELTKTKTLRHLWLSEQITEEAIQKLSAANPDLDVSH